MTPGSFSLEVNYLSQATGPLALIAPQAVQAAATQPNVRVVDEVGQAATLRMIEGDVITSWDQPNELFPSGGQPRWIKRLDTLITDLDLR